MMELFTDSGFLIIVYMTVFFILAYFLRNNGIAEIAWGLGFCIIAVHSFYSFPPIEPRPFIITYLTVLWGLRLSSYIFLRSIGKPEDFRYQKMRESWGKKAVQNSFTRVFMLQGMLILWISIPILQTNYHKGGDLNLLDLAGIILWTTGFLFELVADWQMWRFKRKPLNKGKVLQTGLWRYSRHPNYFGEVLVWWGIFVISISAGNWYISIISPVMTTFLLLKVSGVTLLEKKYEGNDDYNTYKKQTPVFIPWFPKQ